MVLRIVAIYSCIIRIISIILSTGIIIVIAAVIVQVRSSSITSRSHDATCCSTSITTTTTNCWRKTLLPSNHPKYEETIQYHPPIRILSLFKNKYNYIHHHHHHHHFPLSKSPTVAPSSLSSTSTLSSVEDPSIMFPFPKIPMTKIHEHIRNTKVPVDRNWGQLLHISSSSSSSSTTTTTKKIYIHCIVLVHGWMGNSKELSYLQSQLIREVDTTTATNSTEIIHPQNYNTNIINSKSDTNNNNNINKNNDLTYFLTYSSVINEGRTSDGVIAGGQRLAYEINTWIQQFRQQILQSNNNNNNSNNCSNSSCSNCCGEEFIHPQRPTLDTIVQYDISLSLIGNSLGGLYARYALRDIQFQYSVPPTTTTTTTTTSNRSNNDHTIQVSCCTSSLRPALFITTCTPHLGVGKDQSYIPNLPLWIQSIVAKCIGRTGDDLFRIPTTSTSVDTTATTTITTLHQNKPQLKVHDQSIQTSALLSVNSDIIQEMACRVEFIRPLQNFHRRLALCNTYRTDLQVPCSTAAFLMSPSSVLESRNGTFNKIPDYYHISEWHNKVFHASNNKSCISLIVETAVRNVTSCDNTNQVSLSFNQQRTWTSNEIANQLDSLGWMKIFCDTRPYLPYIRIPSSMTNTHTILIRLISTLIQYSYNKIVLSFTSSKQINKVDSITKDVTWTSTASHKETKEIYSSQEIWDRYINTDTDTHYDDEQQYQQRDEKRTHRWYLPFGHTVLVANAKNEWYGQINAAGQPTMDQLAKIIIHEIIQSTPTTTK